MAKQVDGQKIKDAVREHYGGLVGKRAGAGCCSGGCCDGERGRDASPAKGGAGSSATYAETIGYSPTELAQVPEDAAANSFGCGNPLALAEIREGDVVLDIGSGAGMDSILAARRAGPAGKVIGLDMTPEMIARAQANVRRAGLQNVEFRLGDAEKMPVENVSVDLVISNCVINLAPDKDRVFSEAFRVLKNGGRLMISDMVAEGLPDQLLEDRAAWCSCISGAMPEREYLEAIRRAGFGDVQVLARADLDPRFLGGAPDLKISSIKVGAVKAI